MTKPPAWCATKTERMIHEVSACSAGAQPWLRGRAEAAVQRLVGGSIVFSNLSPNERSRSAARNWTSNATAPGTSLMKFRRYVRLWSTTATGCARPSPRDVVESVLCSGASARLRAMLRPDVAPGIGNPSVATWSFSVVSLVRRRPARQRRGSMRPASSMRANRTQSKQTIRSPLPLVGQFPDSLGEHVRV